MMFHAKFRRPSLRFVCNHDALIDIFIDNGHYNSDLGKVTQLQPAKV
jgi:hypothetical protein